MPISLKRLFGAMEIDGSSLVKIRDAREAKAAFSSTVIPTRLAGVSEFEFR